MSNNNPVAAAVAAVTTQAPESSATTPESAQTAKDPRFEAMERRERQFRQKQEEFKKAQEAWEAQRKSYETEYVPKSKLSKESVLNTLQEQGMNLDEIAEMLLAQPNQNDPATKAMLAKIQALEAKQRDAEKRAEEVQQKQYNDAIKQINTEVSLLVDSDSAYETIKASGMQEAVTELIKSTFEAKGYIMDISEAAKQVEDHLVEEGWKLAQTSKIQQRLKPAAETPTAQPQTQAQKPQTVQTLSNNLQTKSAGRSSERERRERAIAAFYGNKGNS